MTPPPDAATLAERLPGRWAIMATNFPMWLRGDRHDPVIEYGLVSTSPLVLSDSVEYTDERRGDTAIAGTDTEAITDDGVGFVWRGTGLLGLLRSRWSVCGLDDEVLVIRFARSMVTPAGLDVLVAEGSTPVELRRRVAERVSDLGITVEEFAGLTWFN